MESLKLAENVYWLGVQDHDLEVFDVVMETKYGTSYNSYFVKGEEKVALFDTVKAPYFDDYLKKIEGLVSIDKIDYLIVHHTEPDHAGSIEKLIKLNPNLTIIASAVAIRYLRNIVNIDFKSQAVKMNDELDLGGRTLKFISAPNLHWPDTIYSYLVEEEILFTCDSFGSHYAFDEVLMSKLPASKNEDYMDALLNYYNPIFAPFKTYVLKAIASLSNYKIKMICPGHGPVLDARIEEIMNIYKEWSTENFSMDKLVVIPFTSAYGYTKIMAETIKEGILMVNPSVEVRLYDLDIKSYPELKEQLLQDLYQADAIAIGATTINKDAVPIIWDVLTAMNPVTHGGKFGAAFGSYGWSGEAVDNVHARLTQLKLKMIDPVKLCFKPDEEKLVDVLKLGKAIGRSLSEGKLVCDLD
ncbi:MULTISPECIES: FprA family A-type flavoprotein [Turicibacter]|jgi:putative type A flavoprotein|uniref:MBL fold metallo-hydrolase n=4 Tax=Turicibacter sanguinis TaxID=154288 RepID=A0A173R006_9FIRM|nr:MULTISPECIES: FprA family A-type flavoprotein [Turicibacter]EFF64415.1 putative type A flavoprotein [Turicibacter sanguinis PC909]MBP3903434.1 FprA family A-type flavoprotein [Turicibacter sp.]MCU7190697.1 FprA family A-type flavoprotein [Turicibacter sanguinis]MCU7196258.1 FprA family A-type flavoprotein [Turicibacter sanguinis]MCU7201210.1 FprA family A-type flavoprotein [Turicibacter sanguinis]